jgi:hypothetical protein
MQLHAQVEPTAGSWKTWFIPSGKIFRLAPPPNGKNEVSLIIAMQKDMDPTLRQQISFWNAGAPGYRWQDMMSKLWVVDTGSNGALANMLLSVATYDATIAAWDTKFAFKRARPFETDKRVKAMGIKIENYSYPCEYSVAAGVAATIIAHFFPKMADSVNHMAMQEMNARIASGFAFPSDTRAGFDLGKMIAEKEIKHTKGFVTKLTWDRVIPSKPGQWNGKFAMFPLAGHNKTVVLDSASEFRPGPPPDFTKDMAELKNFKQSFRSAANAYFWASQDFWTETLNKKIFEYNLNLNAPRAARLYAINAIGQYDGFIACWDAKYTYWGIRPDQYDTSFHSLLPTPPFPGYPSGHAALSGVASELFAYFFPMDQAYFRKKAKDAAESRFQAGIHFRTDNEVALDLGRKIAASIIRKVENDGSGNNK